MITIFGKSKVPGVVTTQNVQNYVKKHMGSALKQFVGTKVDDSLKANIKGVIMSKLYALQNQGVIYSWIINGVDVKYDGTVNVKMDIQPSFGNVKKSMSEHNYHTHNWDPENDDIRARRWGRVAIPQGDRAPSYKCKDCGIEATVMDEEIPVIIASNDLNCTDYAIKDVIE